jgi:hypothetical protein
VRQRPVHDLAGECATVLAYTFDSAETASRVAARLGTVTLDRSGKHNYANMPQLARGHTGKLAPLPFARTMAALDYQRGNLPRTDSLLARTIALSVGVVDSYLGTATGIDIGSTPARIEQVASEFRSAVTQECKGVA